MACVYSENIKFCILILRFMHLRYRSAYILDWYLHWGVVVFGIVYKTLILSAIFRFSCNKSESKYHKNKQQKNFIITYRWVIGIFNRRGIIIFLIWFKNNRFAYTAFLYSKIFKNNSALVSLIDIWKFDKRWSAHVDLRSPWHINFILF